MRQIRKNVFETNSSSSHSLVIRKDELLAELEEEKYFTHDEMLDSIWLNKNGVWNASKEDWYFGRFPFRPLDSFRLRFMYAYANFCGDEDKEEELFNLLEELLPEIKEFKKPESTGTDDYPLAGWMQQYKISLREFLTNKKYVVIQDGDEYNIWKDLIESGLIDTKNIENAEDIVNAM